MYTKHTKLKNPGSLHARSASKFVQTAIKYQSEIYIIHEDEQINAKSILGLLSSVFTPGARIALQAEGPDEKDAVTALCYIIEKE